jgi:major inositol transporter-like SP family MFS transporter
MADRFGRVKMIKWNGWIVTGAAVFAALAQTAQMILINRFILGFAAGSVSVVTNLYIAEIAPSHVRGRLGAVNQLGGWGGIIGANHNFELRQNPCGFIGVMAIDG